MKKLSIFLSSIIAIPMASNAFYNMSYVEVNSNELSNIGCYVLSASNRPFFDMTSIFAANINGDDPNHPKIYFNPQVSRILNNTNQVKELQNKGIKVLLTLLGNHENAGWSCMTDSKAAKKFADDIANTVLTYNLDGIDIDDEYSTCASNDYSMIMIAKYLKENPKFKGKLLTKALWQDSQYFQASYQGHKLSDYLDYGWEMSYYGGPSRLQPYLDYGMSKNSLALGVSTNGSSSSSAQWIKETMSDGYGGSMIYNVTKNSQSYISAISTAEYNQTTDVIPSCLK